MAKVWSKLPGYERAGEVITQVKNNQVLLITAETGSGKTVLMPKYVLHVLDYKGKIAVTLPKQIITRSSAEYAAATLDVKLGEQVGYQYRGSPSGSKSSSTQLLYATDGTIVARLLNDPELKDFDAVIIDEAHERKIQIDFLLYLLRGTVSLRPDFKVIIMSATINSEIFKRYFEEFKFKEIMISGRRNFPIKSIFLDKPMDYRQILVKGFDEIIELLDDRDKSSVDQDILFFITSSNEAFDICKKLYMNDSKYSDVFCIEVFSGIDSKKQELAQNREKYKEGTKFTVKLVIATNVAESSLTIDGIKYVLDSGYELRSSYDPDRHAKLLDRVMITNAQAKQRMGRAGRTGPGICYHYYTESDFNDGMEKFPQPDIRVSDLSGPSLKLMSVGNIVTVDDLLDTYMNFIEGPKENYIRSGITDLIQLGAIRLDGITNLGKMMSDLNLDPMPALTIIIGKVYNCSNELINIMAMMDAIRLNMNNLFVTPSSILKGGDRQDEHYKKNLKRLELKYNKAKSSFKHKYGDHLSLLNVFTKFNDIYDKHKDKFEKVRDWLFGKFLKLEPLIKARGYAKKLRNNVKSVVPRELTIDDVDLELDGNILKLGVEDRVMASLTIGYQLNKAVNASGDIFRTRYASDRIKIDKNSFLMLNKTLPKDVLYSELFISMGRAELNIVSKIPKQL